MHDRKIHQAELTQILNERIDSKEWWIFLPTDMVGAKVLQKLERRFYWGNAGYDFDVAILQTQKFSVALGRKTKLPKRKLLRFLAKSGGIPEAAIDDQDIIILGTDHRLGTVAIAYLMMLCSCSYPEMN